MLIAPLNTLQTMFQLTHPHPWLLASLAAAVLVANTARLLWPGLARKALPHSGRAAVWLIASLYLLLPPLAAWRAGALSPFYLGIAELDWVRSVATGGGFGAIILAVLLVGWLAHRRSLRVFDVSAHSGPERAVQLLQAPLDAALLQWHWAFYRAAAIGILESLPLPSSDAAAWQWLAEQPLYWGSWLGMAVAAVEWALNPYARAALTRPGSREAALRAVGLAVATTALFVLTRNFWVCLACHVAAETLIAGWFPAPVQTADG